MCACGKPSPSGRCRSCAASARWLASNPVRTCEGCGGPIEHRNRARARWCSVVCRTATPGSHTGRSTNRVELTCEGCSVRFQVPASQAPRHRFCTRDCSLLWRGAETTCAECGVRFHHGAGTLGKRKHCSRACYLRAKGETGPERVTREVLEALAVTFWQEQQLGRWVVDFLVGTRLVLEVDGAYWHSLRPEVDVRKTGELRAVGFNVVRLPEERVLAPRFAEDLQGLLVSHGALVAQ